jgi:hypothetical protein
MISQIEIRNFRCFKQVKIQGLKRFNFIVGESGAGKTAFIEALFLVGGGNPEIWFRLRRWRGIGEGPIQLGLRQNYEALFRDMFYGFDQQKGAYLRIIDSKLGKRELEIYYSDSNVLTLPVGEQKGTENAFSVDPINFKWDFGNRIVHSKVEFKDGGLQMKGTAEVYPVFLVSPRTFSGRESAQFYSNLSRAKHAQPVLDGIRSLFGEVEEISIELVAGEPLLHVSLPGLPEKLPLGDLSGGLNKYIEILLAILTNPGGALLIDEIENGFHYRNLPDLLKNIVALCDKHDVQLFATTHSYEFLQVMAGAMSSTQKGKDDFSLLRLERKGTESPTITNVSGDSFEAAINEDFEVR